MMSARPQCLFLLTMVMAAGLLAASCQARPSDAVQLQDYPIGGDFVLTDRHGEPFRLADQRGKVGLLFFGYTYCPDACPTTLAKLARVAERLGDRRRDVVIMYVTVDPARDTPEAIGQYLDYFSLPVVGLTGSEEETSAVARQYAAFVEKEPPNEAGDYLVTHTTSLFLIDQEGRVRALFDLAESPDRIVEGVEQLMTHES